MSENMLNEIKIKNEEIENKIFVIRGQNVMLDSDLASLYMVETKVLNQAVKRNVERFPIEFMFQLTEEEFEGLRSQFVTSKKGGRRYLPFVFTEHGVSMLSAVLNSKIAIEISIVIIKKFVSMRRFISENLDIYKRIENLESRQNATDIKIDKVFEAIENKTIKKNQGVFFNGEIFDAYIFITDIIKSAKKSIVIIDNYIDEIVLSILSKNTNDVEVKIYTSNITRNMEIDVKKYRAQYGKIEINEFKDSHDRFLIIDEQEIYHFGASLKDLGKKWFAFSKFDKEAVNILKRLKLNEK